MSSRSLTTTSYAVLGLLAIQPWATYDLAKLMGRSLHFFWPRAESNLYAEPKRLVEAGLAGSREEWHGERKRTVYSITREGRDALSAWLATPTAPSRLESEPHLRVLYANYGTKDDVLESIERVEADADASLEHFDGLLGEYDRGEGLFPERIHVNVLMAALVVAQARAAVDWARWAREQVDGWQDTVTPDLDWAHAAIRALNEDDRSSDAT
jgi:PadR family transcriptional regulator AphA